MQYLHPDQRTGERCCPPSRQDGGRKDGKDSVRAVNVVNVVNVHPEPVRRVWRTRLKAVRSSAVAVVCPSASKTWTSCVGGAVTGDQIRSAAWIAPICKGANVP
jgi:hypothetical protein